jgi:hypothetical protein
MATSKGTRCLAVPSCFTFQCASSSSLEVRTPSSSSCSHAATVRIHTRQHRRTRAPVSLLAATAISPPWTDSVSWSMGYELGSPSFPFKNNSNSNIIPGIIHRSPCLCRVSIQKHCFFLGGFRGIGAYTYWEEWIDGISSDTGADSEVLVAPWRGLREQEEQDHPLPSCHVQGNESLLREHFSSTHTWPKLAQPSKRTTLTLRLQHPSSSSRDAGTRRCSRQRRDFRLGMVGLRLDFFVPFPPHP